MPRTIRTTAIALTLAVTVALTGGVPAHALAPTPPPPPFTEHIAGGDLHTCALTVIKQVRCWGGNGSGQLGDRSTTNRSAPAVVGGGRSPLVGASQVTAGAVHSCVLLTSTQVRCWGGNESGQLGDGTTTSRTGPVVVVDGSGAPLTQVVQIAAGDRHTCAVLASGQARCWGLNSAGALGNGGAGISTVPVVVGGSTPLTGVRHLGAGRSHTCAALTNGQARCWGDNRRGQLGDGTTTLRSTPVPVVVTSRTTGIRFRLTGVTQVTAGIIHSCARRSSGTAACWGANFAGQLGDRTTTDRSTAVGVGGAVATTGIVSVTAGGTATCALTVNRQARCWGANTTSNLGDGTNRQRTSPVAVLVAPGGANLSTVMEVTAGDAHTCARLNDSSMRCWGLNSAGALGTLTSGGSNGSPQAVRNAATRQIALAFG